MNIKIILPILTLAVLANFNSRISDAFAQGALTPPVGAPAPVMKSLSQIEPRTPISTLPITITNSGSYYLTTNLTTSTGSGITIFANNVHLDLNGFTIRCTAASPLGVGITIRILVPQHQLVTQRGSLILRADIGKQLSQRHLLKRVDAHNL